jgi:hypothetical protein
MDENKLYELISKIIEKVRELETRNEQIEELLTQKNLQVPETVIVEERYEPDDRSISSSKKTVMSDGSFVSIVGKPFCVSGHHLIQSEEEIMFCSKCGRVICKHHAVGKPPLCFDCAVNEINLSDEEAYVLDSIVYNKPLAFEVSDKDRILQSLENKGYLKRRWLFFYKPTLRGYKALSLLQQLLDKLKNE